LFRVDLTVQRPDVKEDNRANQAWNLRTLILMARGGLLSLESERPRQPEPRAGETDEVFAARRESELNSYYTSCAIRMGQGDHYHESGWQSIESVRRAIYSADQKNLAQMRRALAGNDEFSQLFRRVYAVKAGACDVHVERVCGGCPVCRREGADRSEYSPPAPTTLSRIANELSGPLLELAEENPDSPLIVKYSSQAYNAARWRRIVVHALLRPLLRWGVVEVAASDDWWRQLDFRGAYRAAPNGFVIRCPLDESGRFEFAPARPRFTLLAAAVPPRRLPPELHLSRRALHVVLAPNDTPHPTRDGQRLFDFEPAWTLEEMIDRLNR